MTEKMKEIIMEEIEDAKLSYIMSLKDGSSKEDVAYFEGAYSAICYIAVKLGLID